MTLLLIWAGGAALGIGALVGINGIDGTEIDGVLLALFWPVTVVVGLPIGLGFVIGHGVRRLTGKDK